MSQRDGEEKRNDVRHGIKVYKTFNSDNGQGEKVTIMACLRDEGYGEGSTRTRPNKTRFSLSIIWAGGSARILEEETKVQREKKMNKYHYVVTQNKRAGERPGQRRSATTLLRVPVSVSHVSREIWLRRGSRRSSGANRV